MSELTPTTLFAVAVQIQALEALALSLPPLRTVMERIDVYEMECERNGLPVPRNALDSVLPIYRAAAEFQDACRKRRDVLQEQRQATGVKVEL